MFALLTRIHDATNISEADERETRELLAVTPVEIEKLTSRATISRPRRISTDKLGVEISNAARFALIAPS